MDNIRYHKKLARENITQINSIKIFLGKKLYKNNFNTIL